MFRCEMNVFHSLCEQVIVKMQSLISMARFLAEVDVACALAELAAVRHYVRPTITLG